MFLMKVIQKIRFALVIENEIFYINGSETLPPPLTREEEQHICLLYTSPSPRD